MVTNLVLSEPYAENMPEYAPFWALLGSHVRVLAPDPSLWVKVAVTSVPALSTCVNVTLAVDLRVSHGISAMK